MRAWPSGSFSGRPLSTPILLGRCARVADGNAATAPPTTPKNSRRPRWIFMRPSGGGHIDATEGRYHALVGRSVATSPQQMESGYPRKLSVKADMPTLTLWPSRPGELHPEPLTD